MNKIQEGVCLYQLGGGDTGGGNHLRGKDNDQWDVLGRKQENETKWNHALDIDLSLVHLLSRKYTNEKKREFV